MANTLNDLMYQWYSNMISGVTTVVTKIAGKDGTTVSSDTNPFPVTNSGVFNSVLPTLTNGQRADLQLSSKGLLRAIVSGSAVAATDGFTNSLTFATDSADATSQRLLATGLYNFNGTNWDRQRGDTNAAYAKAPPLAGVNRSITATTTSQTLMAANTTRSKFIVSNDSAVDVWINLTGGTAVAAAGLGNKKIAAGGYFELEGTSGLITIIAASATAAVTAMEY